MPIYNLLEYIDNYPITSGSLCNYYRDEINDGANGNNDDCNKINNNKTIISKFSEYKTKKIARTAFNNNTLNVEVVVPFKYLNNFWRYLD